MALLYGVTGTLNMADLAREAAAGAAGRPRPAACRRGASSAVAFLAKAAMWPLNFWLAPAYAAASAPVAALFAILTKVGVYAVLRLWTPVLSAGAGASARSAATCWSVAGWRRWPSARSACSRRSGSSRLAGFSIIVSSGTLLAAIGFGTPALTGGALFYLLSSTLAASALFLLVELIERSRDVEPTHAAARRRRRALPLPLESLEPPRRTSTSTTTRRR